LTRGAFAPALREGRHAAWAVDEYLMDTTTLPS